MNEFNVCEHCSLFHPLSSRSCSQCRQPLVVDSKGAISVWRLGDIEDGVLGPVMSGVRRIFGRPVVLQPGFLDERPSARPKPWKGISATTFLKQVARRHRGGAYLSLGVTEINIVESTSENFLFGLAFESSAVMSLMQIRDHGRATSKLIAERVVKIAAHELGHGLGLDHHPYGTNCVMEGDLEQDNLITLDAGTDRFCRECRKALG